MSQSLEAMIATALGIDVKRVSSQLAFQSIPEWDSMNHVNLILALEKRLGIAITAEQMVELVTVADIQAFAARPPSSS